MKAMRVAERRRARNKPVRSGVKTRMRKAEREITAGNVEAAQALVVEAVSALDKAAEKGIIHPNNAARHKSRLMQKFNHVAEQPTTKRPRKARAKTTS